MHQGYMYIPTQLPMHQRTTKAPGEIKWSESKVSSEKRSERYDRCMRIDFDWTRSSSSTNGVLLSRYTECLTEYAVIDKWLGCGCTSPTTTSFNESRLLWETPQAQENKTFTSELLDTSRQIFSRPLRIWGKKASIFSLR